MKHYNIPKFQHIIVDEAQDIDDNRADIIKHMYASRAPLSLSIFGDPRQRINANSGKWYSDLWSKSQYQVTMFKLFPETAYDDPDADPIPQQDLITVPYQKLGFSISHRFKTPFLLKLHNDISIQRPHLHVQLFAPTTTISSPPYIHTPTPSTEMIQLLIEPQPTIELTIEPHPMIELTIAPQHMIELTIAPQHIVELDIIPHNNPNRESKIIDRRLKMIDRGFDMDRGLKIKCYNAGHYEDENQLVDFAQFLKVSYIENQYCGLGDIVIVMPSVAAGNETSRKARRLSAILHDQGINTYTRREGSFIPNGILITTIHSVKGKQFKVVILYCMSEFPRWYPQIPRDVAEGLTFVAHTRATHEILYLCNNDFKPPRGISQDALEYVNFTPRESQSKDIELDPQFFGVTNVVTSHGWYQLFDTNAYSIIAHSEKLPKVLNPGIGHRLFGIMIGLIIQTWVLGHHLNSLTQIATDNIVTLSSTDYIKCSRAGTINRGMRTSDGKYVLRLDSINGVYTQELDKMKHYMKMNYTELTWREWLLISQIYDFVCDTHMKSRYEIAELDQSIIDSPFPIDDIKLIVESLKRFNSGCGFSPTAEGSVKFGWIQGQYDLCFEDHIVELKATRTINNEHRHQVCIYNSLLEIPRKFVHVYNVVTGDFETITSPQSGFYGNI